MKIPARSIAVRLETLLKKNIHELKEKNIIPHLSDILIGESKEHLELTQLKKKIAEKLKISYELIHYPKTPIFEKFAQMLKQTSFRSEVTGVIIEQPLPPQLQTDSIYKYISISKEVEGHLNKSPYFPPLGLAVLSTLKYVFFEENEEKLNPFNMQADAVKLKKALKHKRIVLIGRGITGGQPIGKTLTQCKINYLSINSGTHNPQQYYCEADILITAVGKEVISSDCVKQGAVVLNIGLHPDGDEIKGDFNEQEIAHLCSFHSSPPTSIATLGILYLYQNLLAAASKSQKS